MKKKKKIQDWLEEALFGCLTWDDDTLLIIMSIVPVLVFYLFKSK